MARMGVLQIDSVNVFSRSHYMPMFSRIGDYDTSAFDRTFFDKTTHYVEYLAHEATFVPVEDWALWRFRMNAFHDRYGHEWEHEHRKNLDWVRAELAERGPSRPADIRGDAPKNRGPWWDWDDVKRALEHLWRTGEVAIAGRQGFERRYALAEQIVPDDILNREIARDDAIRELIRRAARSSGVATEADLADYYRIKDRAAIQSAIRDLADAGELRETRVRGWERGGREVAAWIHADAAAPRRIEASALLTPFDPVVWFRERALRMFDLDYRIEIYTPAAKRRYGYYSLPVLVGDRIVARVDLKADRASSTLRVQSAWWEAAARPQNDVEAVSGEILRAARWQSLEHVSISNWGDATDDLARVLSGHPERTSELTRHAHPQAANGR